MNFYFIISIMIITFIFIIINSIMPRLNYNIYQKQQLKRLQHGITSRQDLYNLESNISRNLIKNLLFYLGYINICLGSSKKLQDIDFQCNLGNDSVYVVYEFIDLQEHMDKESELYKIIGRPYVQKLLGRMVHDGITKGIIFTNADVSEEAKDFMKKLQNDYEIKFFDGLVLTKYIANYKYYSNAKEELIYV